MSELKNLSYKRKRINPNNKFIERFTTIKIRIRDNNKVSLNIDTRNEEKEELDELFFTLRNDRRIGLCLRPFKDLEDFNDYKLSNAYRKDIADTRNPNCISRLFSRILISPDQLSEGLNIQNHIEKYSVWLNELLDYEMLADLNKENTDLAAEETTNLEAENQESEEKLSPPEDYFSEDFRVLTSAIDEYLVEASRITVDLYNLTEQY